MWKRKVCHVGRSFHRVWTGSGCSGNHGQARPALLTRPFSSLPFLPQRAGPTQQAMRPPPANPKTSSFSTIDFPPSHPKRRSPSCRSMLKLDTFTHASSHAPLMLTSQTSSWHTSRLSIPISHVHCTTETTRLLAAIYFVFASCTDLGSGLLTFPFPTTG